MSLWENPNFDSNGRKRKKKLSRPYCGLWLALRQTLALQETLLPDDVPCQEGMCALQGDGRTGMQVSEKEEEDRMLAYL